MPIPKPGDSESKKDFLERCMSDDVMNEEYPDEKQRYAVCQTQWKEKKQIPDKKEIRSINNPASIELREDGQVGAIYGYPIVYNKDSEDIGFIERIAPGAATKALKRSDIRALKNHDPSLIFGRQGVNLKFIEDKNGVKYEATPINTQTYQEIAEEVRLGLLTGQSFGFTILADKWDDLDSDMPKRTITEIGQIFDVGPVTYPAYQDTSVALRSLEQARAEEKPAFEEVIITLTVGEESQQFSLNDDEVSRKIDDYINSLRSGLSPTTSVPDNADDVQTDTQSSVTVDDDLMDKIKIVTERNKE